MPRLGDGLGLHQLAPDDPYQIRLTPDAADDLESALARHRARSPEHLQRFTVEFDAALERIAVFPHLARRHHDRLRVTALPRSSYRLWYVLDEANRSAVLIGIVAVNYPWPNGANSRRPVLNPWWHAMPHLPALLPDPYPLSGWAYDPDWQEQDTGWWQTRLPDDAASSDAHIGPVTSTINHSGEKGADRSEV